MYQNNYFIIRFHTLRYYKIWKHTHIFNAYRSNIIYIDRRTLETLIINSSKVQSNRLKGCLSKG